MGDLPTTFNLTDVSPPHCVGDPRRKAVKAYIDPHEDRGAQGEPNFQPVRLVVERLPNVEL